MNHCQHCGNEIPDGAAFCPSCGKPVKEIIQENPPEAKPGVMIAFWIFQLFLAYTKRPHQLKTEFPLIVIGFLTSLIFYRILKYKANTVVVSILAILLGMAGYVIIPPILAYVLTHK